MTDFKAWGPHKINDWIVHVWCMCVAYIYCGKFVQSRRELIVAEALKEPSDGSFKKWGNTGEKNSSKIKGYMGVN